MSLMKHQYHYEYLVIGSSLSAVIYSYLNNVPLLLSNYNPPQLFDFFDKRVLTKNVNIRNKKHILKNMNGEEVEFGISKLEVYERIIFTLSISGMIKMVPQYINQIELEDNNTLKITTNKHRIFRITYDNLFLFDDDKIINLPVPEKRYNSLRCIDWFDTVKYIKRGFNIIRTSFDFCDNEPEKTLNKIYFYCRVRADNTFGTKQIICISLPTVEEYENEQGDYTHFTIKLYAQDFINRNTAIEIKKIARKIKLEHKFRIVQPIDKNQYAFNKDSNITQMNITEEDLLNQEQVRVLDSYLYNRIVSKYISSEEMSKDYLSGFGYT